MTAESTDGADGLQHLFAANEAWAADRERARPGFFAGLARQQSPQLLWIGCSDSRVPATEIVARDPGEIFVHRNIANVVAPGDLNVLAVLQFAVEVLQVRHIVVTGHDRCGGVIATLGDARPPALVEAWLHHVQDVLVRHADAVAALPEDQRVDRLVELNVVEQVAHVCRSAPVRDAWQSGRQLTVHGWVYGLHDGLLRDLGVTVQSPADLEPVQAAAVDRILHRP